MSSEFLESLFSLKGKKALVTGGYRGIGRVMAETYAEAGADIAIAARNLLECKKAAQQIAEKYNVKTLGMSLDVNDSKVVEYVIREIMSDFGCIDILVNSAGIAGIEEPVIQMTDDDIDNVMNVDFRGTFLVSRAVSKIMIKQMGGKIINVSSILGKIAARHMSGYCASKAAVIQLTRVMALELLSYNIQVNVLCPGYILTEFNSKFFNSDVGKKFINRKIPLNRTGNLDELKSTALYLATCPAFFTGAELCIDGAHSIT